MNSVVMSICIQVFVGTNVLISLAIYARNGIAGSRVNSIFNLEELSGCFLK